MVESLLVVVNHEIGCPKILLGLFKRTIDTDAVLEVFFTRQQYDFKPLKVIVFIFAVDFDCVILYVVQADQRVGFLQVF